MMRFPSDTFHKIRAKIRKLHACGVFLCFLYSRGDCLKALRQTVILVANFSEIRIKKTPESVIETEIFSELLCRRFQDVLDSALERKCSKF